MQAWATMVTLTKGLPFVVAAELRNELRCATVGGKYLWCVNVAVAMAVTVAVAIVATAACFPGVDKFRLYVTCDAPG